MLSVNSITNEKREELNIYRQIKKLGNHLRGTDSMSAKEKFSHLSGILKLNLILKSSELIEAFRVSNIRKRNVQLADFKLLKHSNKRFALVMTNTGFVYLVNFQNRLESVNINEIVFGKVGTPIAHEQFLMEERHLLMLPDLTAKEYFISMNLAEDLLGNLLVIAASNLEKVYLIRYSPTTKEAILVSQTSTLNLRAIEKGETAYQWYGVSGINLVEIFIDDLDSIKVKSTTPYNELCRITGIKFIRGKVYLWQHGNLYDSNMTTILESDKLIVDLLSANGCLMIILVDGSCCLLKPNLVNTGQWSFSQTIKLGGISLSGAAVSLNECVLLTLSQKSLFEESSEFTVYELRSLQEDYSVGLVGYQQGQVQTGIETADMLAWALKTYSHHRGDYGDIVTLLLCSGNFDSIKAMVQSCITHEEKGRQNAEDKLTLLEQLKSMLGYHSLSQLRLLMSQFLLCLKPEKSISKWLKEKVLLMKLKDSNLDPSLIKSLKDGDLSTCHQCRSKSLHLSLSTMTATCQSCHHTASMTIDDTTIRFDGHRSIICQDCCVYYDDRSTICYMCRQRLVTIDAVDMM